MIVDRVENMHEERAKSHARMIAPGVYAGSGPPGSLAAFLKQLGLPGDAVLKQLSADDLMHMFPGTPILPEPDDDP